VIRRAVRAGLRACATTAVLLAAAVPTFAHDIPASVVVQAYVQPQDDHLFVIIRAPLAAMRDVVFPLQGDGLLDLTRAGTPLQNAALTWLAHDLAFYEGDTRLDAPRLVAARASLPSDRSFATFDAALAHVTGEPLPPATTLYWNQALLDVLLEYPIRSDRSTFSVEPTLGRLGVHVVTVLRYRPPGGAERAFEYAGEPGLVHLEPRWHQAALQFVRLGFAHILSGTDHLLFLFCLVIPFRRMRSLILIVTSFTVAHSITLIASAMNVAPGALWFPPLIETLIAASIVYMALENIVGVTSVTRRWMITFAFGLVHGFGFSFALRETLQFAGSHLLTSLLSFNVGVELGQLLVLAALVPALALFFRSGVPERTGTIVLSAIVGHTAWHWMIDRWDRLRQFSAPSIDVLVLLTIVRWTFAAVFVAAVAWLIWPRLKSAYAAKSAAH
jgi:HupE/UreJ protein